MISGPLIRRKSLLEDLQPALEWLESLKIDSKGRYSVYERNLRNFERLDISRGKLDEETYDTAIDASDLATIYRGLFGRETNGLVERLRAFIKGPPHARDEVASGGASHKARSTGIELLTGAHFSLAGLDVSFESNADVEVADDRTLFHIECKRPFVYENVENHISEAYDQLKRSYEAYHGSRPQRGFVTISVGKFMNPGNKPLILEHESELGIALQAVVNQFIEVHRPTFERNLDERTMAVIAYLQMAVALRNVKGMFIQRHLAGLYISKTNDRDIKNKNPDRLYFNEIMHRLTSGFENAFGK